MTRTKAILISLLLLSICMTLAAILQPMAGQLTQDQSDDLLAVLLGRGRRMFADHFFVKADVYFHSGYYPSIFDQGRAAAEADKHMAGGHDEEDHQAVDFLGKPRDWIDAFGRHFYPTTHSHLDEIGEEREILPWLKLSAELDPERVDTYTVAAYWLRERMGKVNEAEQFLRQGMQANPASYEIPFELGKLYHENRKDPARARNLWEHALRLWNEQSAAKLKPDPLAADSILANLANLEEKQGNYQLAVNYLEQEVKYAPQPDTINKHIAELKAKLPQK
jgi:tetratricopeptide (TPR) repeat protein